MVEASDYYWPIELSTSSQQNVGITRSLLPLCAPHIGQLRNDSIPSRNHYYCRQTSVKTLVAYCRWIKSRFDPSCRVQCVHATTPNRTLVAAGRTAGRALMLGKDCIALLLAKRTIRRKMFQHQTTTVLIAVCCHAA